MTILVPSVSIGNVPQLAVDLLIYTYGFSLHSSLDDEYLCPFAGPLDHVAGETPPSGISTAAQLYRLKHGENYIWLVQIRSPPVPGGKLLFAKSLHQQLDRIIGEADKSVILLGSANRGMRLDMDADNWSTVKDPETKMPESGFIKQLLSAFETFETEALIKWTYEGDNEADAEEMAAKLAAQLKLPPKHFQKPVSWTRVYGKDVPTGIEQGIYT